MSKLIPLSDVLILKLVEEKKETSIIVPDSVEKEKEDNASFVVVAVGPGYYENGVFVPTTLKEGDNVIVASYGISKHLFDGKKIVLSRERDAIMKIDRKEE
jgi:co-chaperonin GroES (HSP10)